MANQPLQTYSAGPAEKGIVNTGAPELARPAGPADVSSGYEKLGAGLQGLAGDMAGVIEKQNQLNYKKQELAYEQQQKIDNASATNAAALYHMKNLEAMEQYHSNFPAEGDTTKYMDGVHQFIASNYSSAMGGLSEGAKAIYSQMTNPITIGTYEQGEKNFFTLRESQANNQRQQGFSNVTAALMGDINSGKDPVEAYNTATQGLANMVVGLPAEKQLEAIQSMKQELSATAFTALGHQDIMNGTGAKAALDLLPKTHLDLPGGEPQARMQDTLQQMYMTAQKRQSSDMYETLKDQAQHAPALILNGTMSTSDRQTITAGLQTLASNAYADKSQQIWAAHQLHMLKVIDLAKTYNPANKYEYQQNINQWNPTSPFYKGTGDPVADKDTFDALKEIGSGYEQHWQTGLNFNNQPMNYNERMAAGVGPKLVEKEVKDGVGFFQSALGQQGDQSVNLLSAYKQFSQQYGNDPRIVVPALRQIAADPDLKMNSQRLLALRIASNFADSSPAFAKQLVDVAGAPLSAYTAKWDPNTTDANGQKMSAEAFSRLVANNPKLNAIYNNPLFGRMQDEGVDVRELVTKLAASNVNQNMSQKVAIDKAVDQILPYNLIGNMLVNKKYDDGKVNQRLNQMASNVLKPEDVLSPIRNQVFAPISSVPVLPGGTASLRAKYQPYADQMAQKYNVDPQILRNLITQESGWNPNATSAPNSNGTRDHGIVQINDTSKKGVDPYNPEQAIEYAAKRLSGAVQHYGGDYRKAVASYNAGQGAVDKAGGPTTDANRRYVNNIVGALSQVSALQQRQATRALQIFQSHPMFLSDTSAPGEAVIAGYPGEGGTFTKLVDSGNRPVRVWLKDLPQYTGPYQIPRSVAAGADWMRKATGGF